MLRNNVGLIHVVRFVPQCASGYELAFWVYPPGRQLNRLKNSLWALLGQETAETPVDVVEPIREAMLEALDVHGEQHHMTLDMAIRFANDIAELWYLRPELLQALAARSDENAARETMRKITAMFKGHFSG